MNFGYSVHKFSLPENNYFKYNFMPNFGVTFNLSSLIKWTFKGNIKELFIQS